MRSKFISRFRGTKSKILICIFLHISEILQESAYFYVFVLILHILENYSNVQLYKFQPIEKRKY